MVSATTPPPGETTSFKECIVAEVSEDALNEEGPTTSDGATIEKKPDGTIEYVFDTPISVMEIDVQTKSGEPIEIQPFEEDGTPSTKEPLVNICTMKVILYKHERVRYLILA